MTYERIVEVNKELKLTPIGKKEYVEVNQRVKGFRMLYPEGTIETEVNYLEGGMVVIKATVSNDGKVLATGISYEVEGSNNINKTSFVENCETSAVGRALGFLGLGIDTSICSADELNIALEKQSQYTKKSEPKKDEYKSSTPQAFVKCEGCGGTIKPTLKKDGSEMSVLDMKLFSLKNYGKTLCADCMKKATKI